MKSSIRILAALFGAAVLSGCSSYGPGDREVTYTSTNSVVHAAFAQPRGTPVWDIIGNGTNTELTVKNFVRFTVSSPVAPIPIPASQPGFWASAGGLIERVTWPLLWYLKDTRGSYTPTSSYRGPITINPAPAEAVTP